MNLDPRSFKGLSRFLAPSAGGPLADRALAEKIISPAQLEEAIRRQDQTGRPLDEILVELGYLKKDEVTRLRHPPLAPEVVRAAEDPGRHLGHYVLVSLLGTGGMAEVWKAWDRSLGRWVAVKYLKEGIGHSTQRIEREGRMAGGLSHPGIITIFERGNHNGRAYLVMPFVDGRPPQAPLPPREAARLALEVAEALIHAHKMGVIHRDVKPGNILVEAGGRVVLADFGLAIPGGSGASLWAMSGTPEYASPEQVRGEILDARTDIYSLGATLYHLLSGRPPFTGLDAGEIGEKVLKDPPAPLRRISSGLARIVGRAMSRDRESRYPTIDELAGDLGRFLEKGRRKAGARGILAVLFVLALVPWAGTWLLRSQEGTAVRREEARRGLDLGRGELARAEQLRVDPQTAPADVRAAAAAAVPHFKAALAVAEGELPEASAGLGRSYELMGLETDAEREYRRAEPLVQARMGLARLWLGRHLAGRRDRDWATEALGLLQRVSLERPDDPAQVLARFAAGRWAEVLSLGAAAVHRERYDEMLYLAMGVAARELARWDEAVRRCEQATRLRPNDPTFWYHRALAHEGKGDRAGAREALGRARSLAPPEWGLKEEAEKLGARLAP